MRKIAFLVLITLLFFPSFIIAQTQFELNQSAGEELEKAEAELNEVYQQILKLYNDEKEFLEKLKLSQEAWLKFRDAHVDTHG